MTVVLVRSNDVAVILKVHSLDLVLPWRHLHPLDLVLSWRDLEDVVVRIAKQYAAYHSSY